MVDPRQIPQVENVVEFRWSRWKVTDYTLIELHGGTSDGLCQLLDSYTDIEMDREVTYMYV